MIKYYHLLNLSDIFILFLLLCNKQNKPKLNIIRQIRIKNLINLQIHIANYRIQNILKCIGLLPLLITIIILLIHLILINS